MPEYEAALRAVAESQEHISQSVQGLSNALIQSNERFERQTRQRLKMVFWMLGAMFVLGIAFAVTFTVRQQAQLDALNVVVATQQVQLDNQNRGLVTRNQQFDSARAADVCAQRLSAGLLGVVATGLALPPGSPERAAAQAEFERIGRLLKQIDAICYGPNPPKDPLSIPAPPG